MSSNSANLAELQALYLHVMKHTLADTIHGMTCTMSNNQVAMIPLDERHPRWQGEDWPAFAETMVGLRRLDCVQSCVEQVIADNVPGDLIETGVWRGGTCIFMRALLKAYGVTDKTVYVADSFEGLPKPDAEKYPHDKEMVLHDIPFLAVSVDQVQGGFQRYGLLDDQVKFVKGFFRDTLPSLRDRQWSVVRLDGDMYESTMDGLVNLYPGLSPGGYLILDDYFHLAESAAATDEYRAKYGITEPIERVDGFSGFWRKSLVR